MIYKNYCFSHSPYTTGQDLMSFFVDKVGVGELLQNTCGFEIVQTFQTNHSFCLTLTLLCTSECMIAVQGDAGNINMGDAGNTIWGISKFSQTFSMVVH